MKPKRSLYKVGEFRKQMKEALYKVEQGEEVVIDNYGKQFKVVLLGGKVLVTKEDVVNAVGSPTGAHGCGCRRGLDALCPKHGRY
jgi:hypothetical protein